MNNNDWLSKIQKMEVGLIGSEMEDSKKEMLYLPSPSLNWALGGGLAFGKVLTVYGPEQGGKSLLALLAVSQLHKKDSNAWAVWYDAEVSFDKGYAAKLGVDLNRIWVISSNKPKDIFDHFYKDVWSMMQEGFPCRVMVIDSIKSILGPREADANSVEDHVIGDISQLLGKAFRKIIQPVRKHKVLTICIQQVSEQMDMMKQQQGIKWHVPSGQHLKHFSDYMVLVERVSSKATKIFDDTHKDIRKLPIQLGHTVRCKIDKNRTDSPHKMAEFRLRYGVGVVDIPLEIATLSVNLGIVNRPNNVVYEFQGQKATGFKNFVQLVEDNIDFRDKLLDAINELDVYSISQEEDTINNKSDENETPNKSNKHETATTNKVDVVGTID